MLSSPIVRRLFLVAAMLVSPASLSAAEAPPSAEINFEQACGIATDKLKEMVAEAIRQTGKPQLPLTIILFDANGVALADRTVTVSWKDGTQQVDVPQSGLIVFPIDLARLDGLKLLAPSGFSELKQLSFPGGPTFYRPSVDKGYTVPIINDSEVKENLRSRLLQLSREKKVIDQQILFEQLSRKRHALELPPPPSPILTPHEIYRNCRSSVVVMGTQARIGQFLIATGFVIDPSGIVVTNHHVMNHDGVEVTATGLMTSDGRVFAVQEVLASDPVNDIAIIRIDAQDLPAVTLADDAEPGTPVTVIAHPAERFFYLTHGQVSRYSTWINRGQAMVSMSITADYCPGSSGGPVFDAHGAVAGIVASIKPLGEGMVDKQCIPARAIRSLLSNN